MLSQVLFTFALGLADGGFTTIPPRDEDPASQRGTFSRLVLPHIGLYLLGSVK